MNWFFIFKSLFFGRQGLNTSDRPSVGIGCGIVVWRCVCVNLFRDCWVGLGFEVFCGPDQILRLFAVFLEPFLNDIFGLIAWGAVIGLQ